MNNRLYKSFIAILIAVILIITILHLLKTISNRDFFWHLKTGEWIWQNKSLPSKDPFAFTTPQTHSSREHFALTSYWLSQVIYYLFYLAGRMSGIIFFRFAAAGLLIYFMIKNKEGDNILYLSLLLIFLTYLLNAHAIERPQFFSFLFFAILLYLLEKIKAGDEIEVKSYTLHVICYPFPLLMLIWANMHGGFVLGQMTIILYIVTGGIKFLHPALNPMEKKAYQRLLLAGFCGILVSLANPNTYHVVQELINLPIYGISENLSVIEFFKRYNNYIIILYGFILLLTVVGLILNFKKTDITEITLLLGTGVMSFMRVRYIVFFMIVTLPFAARTFSNENIIKWSRIAIFTISLYFAVFFSWNERSNINRIANDMWINLYDLPVYAADFVAANNLKGNMYNNYNWGGYLIWRLAPERKVFIDGRYLYEQIYLQSQLIDTASTDKNGIPLWKSAFENYGIKYVIIPFYSPSGQLYPLFNALLREKDWIPVFLFVNSTIFVKDTPENYHVIKRFSMPKDYFINDLIAVFDWLIMTNANNIFPYIAKGDLYMSINRYGEAKEAYEKASKIAPFNNIVKNRIEIMEKVKNY